MLGELHPAIVHLPIGILILYSLSELLRLWPKHKVEDWNKTRLFLVVAGVLFIIPTILTGDAREELLAYEGLREIDLHETFAWISLAIYSVMAVSYIVWWCEKSELCAKRMRDGVLAPIWKVLVSLSKFFLKKWLAILVALLGAAALTITGALGGGVVHGPEADPLVEIIYGFFFNQSP